MAAAATKGGPQVYKRRVAVLGFRGVGKSSILQSLLGKGFSEDYEPTVVASHAHSLLMKDGRIRFDLDIIDTAGQDEFSRIPTEASLGVHGYILVYDVTSRASFDQLRVIHDRLLESIGADEVPQVLVANKCDLKTPESQQVTDSEGAALARGFGCQLVETSARTCENVSKLFETVMMEVEKGSGILADDPVPAAKPPGICTVL